MVDQPSSGARPDFQRPVVLRLVGLCSTSGRFIGWLGWVGLVSGRLVRIANSVKASAHLPVQATIRTKFVPSSVLIWKKGVGPLAFLLGQTPS